MGISRSTRPATEIHPLRIAGVCADRQIQALAMCLVHNLIVQTDSGTRVFIRWLKFSKLHDLSGFGHANDWFTEADMFWYAGDFQTRIPGAALDLLKGWCRNKRSAGAIVALLRTPGDRRCSSSPTEIQLRQFAREAGRPLFLRRLASVTPNSALRVGRPPISLETDHSDPANKHVAPKRRHVGGIRGTSPRSKSSPRPSSIVPAMARTATVVSPSSNSKRLPISGLSRRGNPLLN